MLQQFEENGRHPKIWVLFNFRKAVFVPLCSLPFSWSILIRKLMFGGVSESSGSPLDHGHRDFENRCRNGWENWSWSWQPPLENWQKIMFDDVILKNYGANCSYLTRSKRSINAKREIWNAFKVFFVFKELFLNVSFSLS